MAPESSTQTDVTPTQLPPVQQSSQHQHQHPSRQQYQQNQPTFQQMPQACAQPFTPYPQQPFQQMPQQSFQPMPAQQWTPPEIPQNKAWNITKITLHAIDIVFCIVALGLTFSFLRVRNIGLLVIYFCPVLFLALGWDITELITRCVRKGRAGVHPGAHVALSLIIWLSAAVVGGLEATFSAYIPEYDDSSDRMCYDRDTRTYHECASSSYYDGGRGKFIAVAVFTCLVWLVHFILFIGACIDTSKRNAILKRPVVLVNGGYWNQGWQPMPSNYGPMQGQGQDIQMQNQNAPVQTRGEKQGNGVGGGSSNGNSGGPAVGQQPVTEYYG